MDISSSAVSPPSSAGAATSSELIHRGSTEVVGKPARRRFSLEYKRKIVMMAVGLQVGEIGALLRREGLYSSHLTKWRQLIGALDVGAPQPVPGRKPDPSRAEKLKIDKLERDLARAHKRLVQAEAIIDAQKKLCALLGLPSSEERP